MNIFFDTEFTGLHKNTTLISIGLISETGKTFYAEFTDYNHTQIDNWIQKNVINNLQFNQSGAFLNSRDSNIEVKGTKQYISKHLKKWLDSFNERIQFVSDVCHYDMVLLIDLFGSAFDLPMYVNPACHDINQDIARYFNIQESAAFNLSREKILDDFEVNIEGDKHNSLYDAKVIGAIYNEIIEHE